MANGTRHPTDPQRQTPSAIYLRKQRAFQSTMQAATQLAALAHPETGGNHLCVHNWGNAAARAVLERNRERWARYSKASEAAYYAAMHREHEARNEVGRYLWCDACRVAAGSSRLIAA